MSREVLIYDHDHYHLQEQDEPEEGTVCVFKTMGYNKCYVVLWGHMNLGGSLKFFGEFPHKEDAVLYAYAKCCDLEERKEKD